MNANRSILMLMALLMLFAMGSYIGCSDDDDSPTGTDPSDSTGYHALSEAACLDCHTSEDMLKATVEEDGDTPPPSSGEG